VKITAVTTHGARTEVTSELTHTDAGYVLSWEAPKLADDDTLLGFELTGFIRTEDATRE